MPQFIVRKKAATNTALDTNALDAMLPMVPRNCHLKSYTKLKNLPAFDAGEEIIAYASPDSTYAVTKQLFDNAKSEIIIGIYDFTAPYMKQLLLNARQRGVKVTLMLDVDSAEEQKVLTDLAKMGCKCVEAPSCASQVARYFPNSHEKVIVIDGTWCLVQSGNYSANSIPLNEKDGGDPAHFVTGNRDMGVAFKSKEMAGFFSQLLQRDIKLELDAEGATPPEAPAEALPDLVEAFPATIPTKLFPSKTFKPRKKIHVVPVISPENYMEKIPAFLASAKNQS